MTKYNLQNIMNQSAMWKSSLIVILILIALVSAAHAQSNADGVEQDTIKIQGRWTIVVRNSDGSIASRQEFENGLAGSGRDALASILGRQSTTGTWEIVLENISDLSQKPCLSGNYKSACYILEPNGIPSVNGVTGTFPNLSVQVPTSGTNISTIILSGTAKATNAGTINSVWTTLLRCEKSFAPSTCAGTAVNQGHYGPWRFTQQDLTTPVSVQAGQSIDVTVVISFS